MDRSTELTKAKRRHRLERGHGLAGSVFASLSVTLVLVSLVSIAVCAWIVRSRQVEIRLTGFPLVEQVISSVDTAVGAVRSILMGEEDLSIPGSVLIRSVLPNPRTSGADSDHTSPDPRESPESSVEMLPVLASVGQIMTSGVMADPLQTVSSQLPFSYGNLVLSSEPLIRPNGLEVLSLVDVKPVSASWLARSETSTPAGTRTDSAGRSPGVLTDRAYGLPVSQVALPTRPEVQATRAEPARHGPMIIGDTYVYGQNPVVAIYHTHSSEAYQASHDSAYLWGSVEGVVSVGRTLAESLWYDYGVSVVHSTRFHDVEEFSKAYSKSALTVEGFTSRYPHLKLVLDIHRDATGNESGGIVAIGGVRAAEILILVTTDRYGLPHPNWRLNLSAAQRLQVAFDALYPGLSKGVRQRDDGRFNQHLHPGCLLLEIGDVNNTREEAINSTLFASRVIASVLSNGV